MQQQFYLWVIRCQQVLLKRQLRLRCRVLFEQSWCMRARYFFQLLSWVTDVSFLCYFHDHFVHFSFVCPFICLFVFRSFIQSINRSFFNSFIRSFVYSLIRLFVHLSIRSSISLPFLFIQTPPAVRTQPVNPVVTPTKNAHQEAVCARPDITSTLLESVWKVSLFVFIDTNYWFNTFISPQKIISLYFREL